MDDPIPIFFQTIWSLQFLRSCHWRPSARAFSCFSASSAAGNIRSRHSALELGALIIVSTQGFPVQTSKTAFPILAGLCLPGWMCFARCNPLPCLLLLFVKTWPCNETNLNTLYWDKPGSSGYSPASASAARCRSNPLFFSCSWLIKKDQFSPLAARWSLKMPLHPESLLCLRSISGSVAVCLSSSWNPCFKNICCASSTETQVPEILFSILSKLPNSHSMWFCLFNNSF